MPSNCFLSVIFSVSNQASLLKSELPELVDNLSRTVRDYEIIIVDNCSSDETLRVLKQMTLEEGLPNLQIFALNKPIDHDEAIWLGIESALGDYVASIDLLQSRSGLLSRMLAMAHDDCEVVFACNSARKTEGFMYRGCRRIFYAIYERLCGVHLGHQAPSLRLLHRKVVTRIMQQSRPSLAYRHLPATGGYVCGYVSYHQPQSAHPKGQLIPSIDRALRLLLSNSRSPMRVVTGLCVFGACSNVIYSIYVVGISLFKSNVAPGWVSLSLQQSGMFLLLSLVQFVMSEYILHNSNITADSLNFPIANDFHSAHLSRRKQLNVDELSDIQTPRGPTARKQSSYAARSGLDSAQ